MSKGDSNEESEEGGMDIIYRLYRYEYMDMLGWI